MIGKVETVPYGRPASEALAEAVEGAKAGHALAPVTVLVSSNFAGLSVRRLLGSGAVGAAGGLANVSFVTPFRLAELLASGHLGDLRPLTNPVLGAAVREVLTAEAGPLGAVAGHHSTEAAVAALYSELSRVSDDALEAMAGGGGRASEATRLYRATDALLDGFYGESEAADTAAARADLSRALAEFGHVIWHLPEPLHPALVRLVARVLSVADSTVLVGSTQVPDADAPVLDVCARAGVQVAPARVVGGAPAVASSIISVTDADEEVRAVVRRVARLAETGVRLDRIGVFYPRSDPYVRLVHGQFAAAGITCNGPSGERLADCVAGRTLLAALALPRRQWRRDRVMALVSGAPLRHDGDHVHPSAWEEISRAAGIVQGLGDWRTKLEGRAGHLDAMLATYEDEADDPESDGRAPRRRKLESERAETRRLADFVEGLDSAVASVEIAAGWVAKSAAARDLLDRLTGGAQVRRAWPEAEQVSADRVEDALARLATLEVIDPDPTHDVFGRALLAELDVARGRRGRYGQGVVHGLLASAPGQDLDAVFILGMAEGDCPAPRREDALLPDSVRALSEGEIPERCNALHDQHRHFLAALASAPHSGRHLTFPRGDLRGGRHRLPSRWLLDSVSVLAGAKVYSTELAGMDEAWIEAVPSFAAGLATAPSPADLVDRDLAVLTRCLAEGGDLRAHPTAVGVAAGLDCIEARASSRFTEWDGNLAGQPVPSPARGELQSATRLERWAGCGFRYFLADVLHLGERDDPERIVELSPLDRGSVVHTILERFFEEVIAGGPPEPGEAWTTEQRLRLREIALEVLDDYDAQGRTGRRVNWRLVRDRLVTLVDAFLTKDEVWREQAGARPERVELPFGVDEGSPVAIRLGDGRRVLFRGRADRVDRTDDGSLVVFDYKTGKAEQYKGLDADPFKKGTALQLGLYSEAARSILGADDASAYYWMVNGEADFAAYGYTWDDERRRRFVDVVTAIVDGIEAGAFPCSPGDWSIWWRTHDNCRYCGFDDVCVRGRGEQSEAKRGDPALMVREVLEPPGERR